MRCGAALRALTVDRRAELEGWEGPMFRGNFGVGEICMGRRRHPALGPAPRRGHRDVWEYHNPERRISTVASSRDVKLWWLSRLSTTTLKQAVDLRVLRGAQERFVGVHLKWELSNVTRANVKL